MPKVRFNRLYRFIFQDTPAPAETRLDIEIAAPPYIPWRWAMVFAALLAIFGFITWQSPLFLPQIPLTRQPVIEFSGLLLLAGVVFLFLAELIVHSRSNRRLMLAVLLSGALLRGMMFFSTPILEVDFHRYFWDGAMTANGHNPYQYSPEQILRADPAVPEAVLVLGAAAESTLERINHAYLRTIYPPPVQGAFALAYFLAPMQLNAWRAVLLLFDLATLLLLFLLLRYLQLSPLWICIYWLNPLLLKEIFNSGHMDVLIFPFLLGAIYASLRRRPYLAAGALALAAGVKLWPALLLPLILRPFWPNFRRILGAGALFGSLTLLLLFPLLTAGLDPNAGLHAYSHRWQLNDSFFRIVLVIAENWLKLTGAPVWESQPLARKITAFLVVAWTLGQLYRFPKAPRKIIGRHILAIAALFLLSPTQFPWYSLWLLPLLALAPRKSLLLLTLVLPLYYLRYYLEGIGHTELFDRYFVWIEFLPVWYLLYREWRFSRQLNRLTPVEVFPHER
ncbi:MAG: DUF2029 domain-containing protein [Calditrichae bacterium]|nr:DUF2029 domain-containing protein [Calditrichia bacterium]